MEKFQRLLSTKHKKSLIETDASTKDL